MKYFYKKKLNNGLTVLLLKEKSSPLAIVNVLYKVGSINEKPLKTGFAHLFEHFMFEGSAHIADFDEQLERASGENNAFTTNDYTNYYNIVPLKNLDTALWLESDRMLALAFDENGLQTQKSVVCEEYKEYYIDPPYGDAWHLLSALAYGSHPYSWPVIGKDISHIECATMSDVKDFYNSHYTPQQAILCVAGNIDFHTTLQKIERWFGTIAKPATRLNPPLPPQPQKEKRVCTVQRDVPAAMLYLAFKMGGRFTREYYVADLIRDILATGDSSRLYTELVKEKKVFSSISCYLTETIQDGLLVIEAKLLNHITVDSAADFIFGSIKQMTETITEDELQKVKNKTETYIAFTNANLLNRVTNYCLFEMAGDAALYDKETEHYLSVSLTEIKHLSGKIFRPENCAQLNYLTKTPNDDR